MAGFLLSAALSATGTRSPLASGTGLDGTLAEHMSFPSPMSSSVSGVAALAASDMKKEKVYQ